MCSCVENLEKRVVKEQPLKGKQVLKAKLQSQVYLFKSSQIVTSTVLELEVEGRKSPIKQSVIHSYCPFCGSPYNKEKEVSNG